MPNNRFFGPLDNKEKDSSIIIMTIEEYEVIRLIDYQGFLQEEAATQMDVARTTVQRIYNEARKKIASSVVESKILKIEGGNYILCDGLEKTCICGGCKKHRNTKEL